MGARWPFHTNVVIYLQIKIYIFPIGLASPISTEQLILDQPDI